ncbi:hypothetical protein BGZ73_000787 [Actinomortierella ambigua]|nr:hypothetical protein BGZ73_000787 [Actinomortierella ambigua]
MAADQGHPEASERLVSLATKTENGQSLTSEPQQGMELSSEFQLVQSIIDKIDRASAGVKYFKAQSTFLRQKCQYIGRHQNIYTLAGQRGQLLIKLLKGVLEFMHTLGTSGLILQFFNRSEIKKKFEHFNQKLSAWSNGQHVALNPSMIEEDEKNFDDMRAAVAKHQATASMLFRGRRVKVDLDKFAIDPSKVQMGAKIGSYGFGEVYEGTIKASEDIPVHIKLLREHLDPTHKEAIKRGILINRYLQECDNISRLLYISGTRMIVMEATTYPSIHNMFKEGIKISRHKKVAIVCKVAAAVSYIHSCGIIHRNIRGTNVPVNLTEDGVLEPRLGGFESCRDLASHSLVPSERSMWDAPEKIRYGTSMSTDTYAFGVFMWEMSMQRQPYEKLSLQELIRMESGNISKEYSDLMQKCFEPEPENRPQMRDLALALAALT